MKYWMIVSAVLIAAAQTVSAPDPDTDRDGLSDFAEVHKYFTNPHKASTAGGVPDGDWDQRKEFTYTITSVMQFAKPYNLADMNDDYQDARLLSEDANSATVEIVYYPLNTNADGIGENPNWRRDYAGMTQYLKPTITENWDEKMRADLIAALKDDGIDPDDYTDRRLVTEVSRWVMKRTKTNNAFAIWYVHFPNGVPEVFPPLRAKFDKEKPTPETTDQWMFDHEVLGRQMFYNRIHGSCTSSAVLMATVMRALGIPTRIVFFVPPLDANDPAQREMLLGAVHHHRVHTAILHGMPDGHGGFTNHLFNEVFVGNRWVRLNYDVLGQNNLNEGYLGLFTHVFTAGSLASVPMHETWGRRMAQYPNVEPKLSSINPYRLIRVSDHFGKYANIPNPEVPDEELRKVTIDSVFWNDAPPQDLAGKLDKMGSVDFWIGIREYIPNFRLQLRTFLQHASRQFLLTAAGHPDIRVKATGSNITTQGGPNGHYQIFAVKIDPEDREHLAPGVAYSIRPLNDNETYVWSVKDRVVLERKSQ